MSRHLVPVALAERSYSVDIESGLIASGRAAQEIARIAKGKRVCVVTSPRLCEPYAAPIAAGLREAGFEVTTTLVPAGERFKTLSTVARLYSEFLKAGLDRKSLVVAVGGGVLGDIVGFAAASYLRGICFVQVPTTLLAQVDASVGGKTGVDLPEGKNLVGAFHQPSAVLIDPDTLSTLPARELRSGLAEVIKYGIISEPSFFQQTNENLPRLLKREPESLSLAIARSCEIKADVVSQDETEQGLRAILNFGHTLGHAVESVTRYRRFRHGEAVSIGMVSALRIGVEMDVTPSIALDKTIEVLRAARLPVAFPADLGTDAILEAAQRDKKTEAGCLRFVLSRRIGEVFVSPNVPREAVERALNWQRCLA